MRFLRGFLLTFFLLVLFLDLVAIDVGLGLNVTVFSPAYVADSLDRAGAYQIFRQVVLKSVTEGATDQYSKIMGEAVAEAATPELLRSQVQIILPKLYGLIKAPQPQPTLVIDLTEFKATFLASIERRAKELGAPKSVIAEVKAELSAAVPKQLDLIKSLRLAPQDLTAIAGYYHTYQSGLAGAAVLAIVLIILIVVLAGRRAWGPWIGLPSIMAGTAVAGMFTTLQRIAIQVYGDPSLFGPSAGGFDASPMLAVIQNVVTDIWQTYLVISLVTVALGIAVWIMATRLRPRPAPVGAPPAVPAPPTAPPAPPSAPAAPTT